MNKLILDKASRWERIDHFARMMATRGGFDPSYKISLRKIPLAACKITP